MVFGTAGQSEKQRVFKSFRAEVAERMNLCKS